MPGICGFGAYLPDQVVTNAQLAAKLGCDENWILAACGISERRYAEESVAEMAVAAAKACLVKACLTTAPAEVGLVIVASGSAERRFPGPAAVVASALTSVGIPARTPAVDIPMASAGSLFGMSLAAKLAPAYGSVLVVASEKMSAAISSDKNTAILFGDGAGACLISADDGPLRITDSALHSDGSFAEDLKLDLAQPIHMNGRSVIMQASRKVPAAIGEVLARNGKAAADVDVFLMHQANQNLTDKIAKTLGVASERFYSNIRRYGNTSSASMLIAASEWWDGQWQSSQASTLCFAAFGAGFHWGSLLALRQG